MIKETEKRDPTKPIDLALMFVFLGFSLPILVIIIGFIRYLLGIYD
jgi:hypothetical protein